MLHLFNAATFSCMVIAMVGATCVFSHAVPPTSKGVRADPSSAHPLQLVPSEAIVYPGDTVTFECRTPDNVSLQWHAPGVRQFEVSVGEMPGTHFSRITIHAATKHMNGEIVCMVDGGDERAVAILVVNGVRNGGACRTSTDCMTEKATCQEGVCACPINFVRLRVKGRGYDVCKEMIYSLYDPCESDDQCSTMVDPKSVCRSVCVCATWAKDKRGKCVSISEMTFNRSQEMYRVGLIAVTCIIILIVAVSLWVTLKRSCRGHIRDSRRSLTLSSRPSVDATLDKPPSYDDVLVTADRTGQEEKDTVGSPPNFKDALKHCITAKKLLRQVSAPAGQLLPPAFNPNPKK